MNLLLAETRRHDGSMASETVDRLVLRHLVEIGQGGQSPEEVQQILLRLHEICNPTTPDDGSKHTFPIEVLDSSLLSPSKQRYSREALTSFRNALVKEEGSTEPTIWVRHPVPGEQFPATDVCFPLAALAS